MNEAEEHGRTTMTRTVWMIPPILFVVVSIARQIMASVDVSELDQLRYEYKGA